MERAGMPVADGFLTGASGVDGIKRQGDLDELFRGDDGVVGHVKIYFQRSGLERI
jgi:hypothetical protein